MKYEFNPYDFGNPVVDKELFVGRYDEMKEVAYYLNQVKSTQQPISLAILGERASGKTSILNMAEIESQNLDYCTVRINLDEGDAESELDFFFKIFTSLFYEACNNGAFNGRDGKTFEAYLEMTSTYSIPQDKTFCPLLFPIIYAKAMDGNRPNAKVPDNIFAEDLKEIHEAVKKPIVLILDECNVLTKSRVLLQKIRNIFMNMKGYMLIIAGTPDLFPVMDDVFSPIIRQFKKIDVRDFQSVEDTKECIKKPLEKNKIEPGEVYDFNDEGNTREIHDLTNGSPYEINLLCHFLFRRIQENKSEIMKLDLRVLEDVRRQLEIEKNVFSRPLLTRITNLNINQLKALNFLCRCEGEATFEQLWALEYIINGDKKWSEGNLRKHLNYFIEEEIILDDLGVIRFSGDNFDKIYLKYFAKEKRINLRIGDMTLSILWHFSLFKRFHNTSFEVSSLLQSIRGESVDIDESIKEILNAESGIDVFDETPWARELYQIMMINYNKENSNIFVSEISSSWINYNTVVYCKKSENEELSGLPVDFEEWSIRAKERDVKLELKERIIKNIPHKALSEKVISSGSSRFKKYASVFHNNISIESYFDGKRIDEAIFHAEKSLEYEPDNFGNYNNLGYLHMARNKPEDIEKAEQHFKKAISGHKTPEKKSLPEYNLSLVYLLKGDYKEALKQLVISRNSCNKDDKINCLCLFEPKIVNKKPELVEVEDVKLIHIIEKASKVFEQL